MLRKRWFRWAVVLAAILLIASEGFSLLLRTAALRRYLTARLESSFGRPVEVGTFAFSLFDGPRIEALNVSVGEDPRFGQEYFLRADQLIAGPSWSALLTGHFEFGTLSFTRPTLNLVRTSDGHWNLESWLPAPPAPATAGNRTSGAALRSALRFHLSRIEIDAGRINFKQDQDVRPFALEAVTGTVEQQSPGRWRLDIQTQPMRPGAALPQSGIVRIRGVVGGTSSRLQPADLNISLWDATIEDALRLVRGGDFGIRGALSADFHASIEPNAPGGASGASAVAPAEWNISGVVRLAGIHRWNFPDESGEPSANLNFDALWRSGEPRIELSSCDIEAPGSAVRTSGELAWNHGFHPHLSLAPSEIAYGDLLAWYRTFRPGVEPELSIEGWMRAEGTIEDWPLRLVDASLASAGARIVPSATLAPLRFGRWNAELASGTLTSSFVPVQFEPASGAPPASRSAPIRIQASLLAPIDATRDARGDAWRFRLAIDGTADRVQDYLALAREFGWPPAPLWSALGSVAFNVHSEGDFHRGSTDWQGAIEARGLSLQLAFLNQPMIIPAATLVLGAGASDKLTFTAAQAFDTAWTGTIFRNAARPGWQFDLSADRLDADALNRWLTPRARPAGLLERLGFSNPASGASIPDLTAALAIIPVAARGRLRVGEIVLAPLRLAQLDADVELAGKTIDVHRATGSFAGGAIDGAFTAALGATPSYDARAHFDRLDLAALATLAPSLAGKFTGIATGDLTVHAAGIGRDALLDSLEGQGTLSARSLQISGFHLAALRAGAGPAPDDVERFTDAQAVFRIAGRAVRAAPVRLSRPGENLVAAGSVDFQGALDFRVAASGAQSVPVRLAGPASLPASGASSSSVYRLTGSLASPQLAPYGPLAASAPAKPALRGHGAQP